MNIYKFFPNKPNEKELLHSSAHARMASGDKIGSASAGNSFSSRLQKDSQGGRLVGNYRQSAIYNQLHAKDDLLNKNASRGSMRSSAEHASRQQLNIQNTPPRPTGFVEPPRRKYNPYS